MKRYFHPWGEDDHGVWPILRWKWRTRGVKPTGVGEDAPAERVEWREEEVVGGDVRVSWFGHASFLMEFEWGRVWVDPVFSDFCSPLPIASLRRRVSLPCRLEDISEPDLILLTHSHYDHMDWRTLKRWKGRPLVVPAGHGRWFRKRGWEVAAELDWWEGALPLAGVDMRVTATPAKHFSARTPWDRNRGRWCGWVIEVGGWKLWHAGDSAWCPAFEEVGERWEGLDFGMIPIGAYEPAEIMSAVHLNPEEAVRVWRAARCRRAVGMHWGVFRLTDEPMSEPPKRLKAAVEAAGLPADAFVTGKVGESWWLREGERQ